MFNIKTSTRTYFLAVDTAEEMDEWVRMVCSACGLRATNDEDSAYTSTITAASASSTSGASGSSPIGNGHVYVNAPVASSAKSLPGGSGTLGAAALAPPPQTSLVAPPPPPSSKPISSPYIHISECFSGKPGGPGGPPSSPPTGPPPPKPPPRLKSDSISSSSQRHNSSMEEEEQIYYYLPSVDTLNSSTLGRGKGNSVIMIPANSFDQPVAYIDLDLPRKDSNGDEDAGNMFSSSTSSSAAARSKRSPTGSTPSWSGMPPRPPANDSSTIYDHVDFAATEAFNRLKREVVTNRQLVGPRKN